MLRISRYLFIAIIPFIFVSCGGDDKSSEADKAYQRAAAKRAAAAREAAESAEEEKKVPLANVTEISPGNINLLRNPFKSFLVKRTKTAKKSSRVAGPLECCQIGTFRLLAVISNINEPKALVLAPDGKRHTVKLGDRIGTMGGTITSIDKSGVEVSVELTDGVSDKTDIETVKMTLYKGDR